MHARRLRYRVLVFGATDDCKEVFAAYVGDVTHDQENEIKFLKACTLATTLGQQKVSAQTVLGAIQALNDDSERKLGRLHRARVIYAADPKHHSKYHDHDVICKDSELSLQAVGRPVKVVIYDKTTTPTLTKEEPVCRVESVMFVGLKLDYGR